MTVNNKPSRIHPVAGLFFGRNRAEGGPAARRKRAGLRPDSLVRSTALLFSTASIALMLVAGSVFADGGRGGGGVGTPGSGGAGGIEASPNGGDGAGSGGGGGGGVSWATGDGGVGGTGGGNAGPVPRGSGGAGGTPALLTDSTSPGVNTSPLIGGAGGQGANGFGAPSGGGGGGGGGGFGWAINAIGASSTGATVTGGKGGNGGTDGGGGLGGGGGGGQGGGAVLVTNGGDFTTSQMITGGAGGDGGRGHSAFGHAGGGGDGGAGVVLRSGGSVTTATGAAITGGAGGNGGNTRRVIGGRGGDGGAGVVSRVGGRVTIKAGTTITGGEGGIGGTSDDFGTADGPDGAGGMGVYGSNLTIINSGTIAGGLSGDGSTRANAIEFSGGTNRLELRAGSVINGSVDATASADDTFALGGATNSHFDVSQIGGTAQYQGFESFEKTGASTWTLTGSTAAVTPWTLSQGTLSISSDANLGAASGELTFDGGTLQNTAAFTTARNIVLNGAGTFQTDAKLTANGVISGAGALTKTGGGVLELPGTNTYTGGTTISKGKLRAAATGALGAGPVTIEGGGNVDFINDASAGNLAITSAGGGLSFRDTSSAGSATINNNGGGGINFYDTASAQGATIIIDGGGISFNGSSTAASASITISNGGTLDFYGTASADGATITNNSSNGAVRFHGDNTAGNATIINKVGARVDISDLTAGAIGIGSLSGDGRVYLGSKTLTLGGLGKNDTIGGVIQDGGYPGGGGTGGSLVKIGTGTLTLTGANTYTGGTTINAGTLLVKGALGNTATTVASGATLGGSGSIGGAVTIADGATIAPGSSVGTLTVGALNLSGGSILDYELGSPGTAADPASGISDRIDVNGNLTLDGTVNLAQSTDAADGTAGLGYYRLLTYGGDLTDNGLDIGTTPAISGAGTLEIQAGGGNVDLFIASAGDDTLQHWQGGNGTWNATQKKWLNQGTTTPVVSWAGNHAVFKNEPGGFNGGTVTVKGTQSFKGLQFVDSGYRLQGDGTLQIDGNNAEIRVLANETAAIATTIAGNGGITKTQGGTLVLEGNNSYQGGTAINAGTLSVSADGNLGAASGGLTFDGGKLRNTAAFTTARSIVLKAGGGTFQTGAKLTANGVITGPGALTKTGAGTLTLSGDSSGFTGDATVSEGTLDITGKLGTFNATIDYTGGDPDATAAAKVAGTGVSWTLGGNLFVGQSGTGTLDITGGGTVVTGHKGIIGVSTGSAGSVTVTGPDSIWTLGDAMQVGREGTGELIIADGGTVSVNAPPGTNFRLIGARQGSTGTVTVMGEGSAWNGNGSLLVGAEGAGKLTIEAGGLVSSAAGSIGASAGGTGAAMVTGTDSTWTNSSELNVGYGGAGTLTVENGGVVSNTIGNIAFESGSTGKAAVTGDGSTWTNRGLLVVAHNGTGTLTVADGGAVSNTVGYIAADTGSTGKVMVTGPGSVWANSGELYLGNIGDGTLTVADGGTVSATQMTMANGINSAGTLNIGAAAADSATAAGTLDIAAIAFGDGVGTINFNHTGTGYEFASAISGNGAVNQLAGTTILTGASTYTGATHVDGGTLWVKGSLGNTTTTVASGATLGGSGSIGGDVTVADGGTIAPGASIGTLTVGSLSLSGGSILDYELGSPGSAADPASGISDHIDVTGNLTLDGTVNLAQSTDIADGTAGLGYYRLLTYGGSLTDNGLAIGTTPALADPALYEVQAGSGNVDLFIAAAGDDTLQHWQGGDGIWNATNRKWLNRDSTVLVPWAGNHAVFKNEPGGFDGGAVTVKGTQSFKGLQFVDSGYRLQGDGTLQIDGNNAEIRVLAGETAEIATTIAGSGGITKTQGGTLVLEGNNTYQGGTAINGGTLSVSADGNLGAASGVLTLDGGTLQNTAAVTTARSIVLNSGGGTFQTQADLTANGVISGAGTLRKTGDGVLKLTGANTYEGRTTLSDGTLVAAATSALGTGPVTVNAGSLDFINNASAGSLEITNTGGSIRFRDTSSAGTATILNKSAGQVDISDLTADGIAIGSLSGDGAVYLGSKALTLGGLDKDDAIGGVIQNGGPGGGTGGSLIKIGSGMLTLTGANSYTGGTIINDGTLQLGNGGSITGNVEIAAPGTLAYNRSGNFTFDGVFTGGGAIDKSGAGMLMLTGDSSGFAGATTVADGTLLVGDHDGNGSLGGAIDVASGAMLGGSGTVGTTTVADGGTIAPGNSVGTLNVAGDVTFASGSVYQVEVDPAGVASDLIHATGTATLNGGSVIHIGETGPYQPSASYTILTADGGVTGTFADVTSNFAFLDPTLVYDPNNVVLELIRNDINFCMAGMTRNQCATGTGAESTGAGAAIYDAIAGLSADEARAAFDLLSGEIHASTRSALILDSHFVRDAANSRLLGAFGGAPSPTLSVMAYGGNGPVPVAADTDHAVVWGQAFGSWGSIDGDGNAAEIDHDTGGFFIGADGPVAGAWRLGLLAGYSRSDFDADARVSSGSSDNYHLGLYGGRQWGALGLRFGGAYSWHDVETDRSVAFPGFTDSLSADYDAGTAQAFGELGYAIKRGDFTFEPFANLAYVNLHVDGFTEQGGAAALSIRDSTTDATFTTLGSRVSNSFDLGGMTATASGTLGWRHAFGDSAPLSTHAFAGGEDFTIAGAPIAEDAAIIKAGFGLVLSPKATLGVAYQGQIASDARQHGFSVEIDVKF